MRVTSLAFAVLPAVVSLASATSACAGVISYTQALQVSTGSLGPSAFILDLPDFNPKLGKLTQISLDFSGTVFDKVVFENGSPEGGTFTAANNAQMLGSGFSPQTIYGLADGSFTFSAGIANAVSTTTQVSFTASPDSAALAQYTTGLPPGFEAAVLNFGFSLLDAHGNPVGGVSDGETTFRGQVVESYTYTAVSVVEPATMVVVVSGMFVLGWARLATGRTAFFFERKKQKTFVPAQA